MNGKLDSHASGIFVSSTAQLSNRQLIRAPALSSGVTTCGGPPTPLSNRTINSAKTARLLPSTNIALHRSAELLDLKDLPQI
jgi:hypothetical protein